jgi:hypothetical protein
MKTGLEHEQRGRVLLGPHVDVDLRLFVDDVGVEARPSMPGSSPSCVDSGERGEARRPRRVIERAEDLISGIPRQGSEAVRLANEHQQGASDFRMVGSTRRGAVRGSAPSELHTRATNPRRQRAPELRRRLVLKVRRHDGEDRQRPEHHDQQRRDASTSFNFSSYSMAKLSG